MWAVVRGVNRHVYSSHLTDISTHLHPPQPVSAPMPRTRDELCRYKLRDRDTHGNVIDHHAVYCSV